MTRTRWAVGKLVAAGFVHVAAAIAVGVIFQWWDEPYVAERLADPGFGLLFGAAAVWVVRRHES